MADARKAWRAAAAAAEAMAFGAAPARWRGEETLAAKDSNAVSNGLGIPPKLKPRGALHHSWFSNPESYRSGTRSLSMSFPSWMTKFGPRQYNSA